MAITLKDECILNEWTTMVDHGAGNSQAVIEGIMAKLREAEIPGECGWRVEEIKSSGLFARVRREFLVVNLAEFRDYHMYIGIRDYGIHLDCCRFLTVEPGFLKKWAAEKLTGYADALSAPKNILIHQDLRAWATVVHHAVVGAVEQTMVKLGKDTSLLQRGSKGFLEIW